MADPIVLLAEQRKNDGEVLRCAKEGDFRAINNFIYCSYGVSNAYLVSTDNSRLVINSGSPFEAAVHKAHFDSVSDKPIRYIVTTQSHMDHISGVELLRDTTTQYIAQARQPENLRDFALMAGRRQQFSAVFFADFMQDMQRLMSKPGGAIAPKVPVADISIDDEYQFELDGLQVELFGLPGGEVSDGIGVWLPQHKVCFCGNMFGPFFPNFPNFNTIRGDRYRLVEPYLASLKRVLALKPEMLITGHGDPIIGADLIAACLTRLHDAVDSVFRQTLDGINRGDDIYALMKSVSLPADLQLAERYGRVAWAVRTIWETHLGWYKQLDTSELYGEKPNAAAVALINQLGVDSVLKLIEEKLEEEELTLALQLIEAAVEACPDHRGVYVLARRIHKALGEEAGDNYWLNKWLDYQVSRFTQILDSSTI